MLWWRARQQLLFCVLLDAVGCLAIAALIDRVRGTALLGYPQWLFPFLGVYLFLGWLFGSYTVLRWPWLRLRLVVLRLLAAALGTLFVVASVDWLLNLPPEVAISHRSNQALMLSALSLWALGVRLALRWMGRWGTGPDWQVRGTVEHLAQMQKEWRRTPHAVMPRVAFLPTTQASYGEHSVATGLPPRPLSTISWLDLAARQLERLPPALLPEDWLELHQIPWMDSFSVQRQLKRASDIAIALLLLVLTFPLMCVAAFLIYMEDGGDVFYIQERSGLMGEPFRLLKLRTMRRTDLPAPATWTQLKDQRITRVGALLRRVRLDEIPQLLNVLRGEMSLIGPRPERPELEYELEQQIPHYRKRHWMPPGLSGWAQVSAPYAASVEEAELKLSYDLYYLLHWNIGLDLLILLKTIKTVLKARGR